MLAIGTKMIYMGHTPDSPDAGKTCTIMERYWHVNLRTGLKKIAYRIEFEGGNWNSCRRWHLHKLPSES